MSQIVVCSCERKKCIMREKLANAIVYKLAIFHMLSKQGINTDTYYLHFYDLIAYDTSSFNFH